MPQTTTSTANALKVDVCRISEVKVLDPNPPLNLRSTPEVTAGNVVGSLANGTFLRVKSDNKDWFQVSVLDDSGTVGWVSKQRTDYSCNEKQATLTLQPGNSALPIRDRFVSAGNHTYTFTATQGQTLTLVVQSGPAPYLVSPSQDLIAGDGQGGGINGLWSGKLPTTGRYTLSLDSNFRGYSYAFSVQLAN